MKHFVAVVPIQSCKMIRFVLHRMMNKFSGLAIERLCEYLSSWSLSGRAELAASPCRLTGKLIGSSTELLQQQGEKAMRWTDCQDFLIFPGQLGTSCSGQWECTLLLPNRSLSGGKRSLRNIFFKGKKSLCFAEYVNLDTTKKKKSWNSDCKFCSLNWGPWFISEYQTVVVCMVKYTKWTAPYFSERNRLRYMPKYHPGSNLQHIWYHCKYFLSQYSKWGIKYIYYTLSLEHLIAYRYDILIFFLAKSKDIIWSRREKR